MAQHRNDSGGARQCLLGVAAAVEGIYDGEFCPSKICIRTHDDI
jgi:hypothetical protein